MPGKIRHFLLYYKYNFICFWKRLRNAVPAKVIFHSKNSRFRRNMVASKPIVLCRMFIVLSDKLRLFCIVTVENAQDISAVFACVLQKRNKLKL